VGAGWARAGKGNAAIVANGSINSASAPIMGSFGRKCRRIKGVRSLSKQPVV
jgi:hypothetical protein